MRQFEGRTAVVTGGSGGLGQAICRALAEAGAAVVVADVDADAGQAFAAAIGGHFHPLDVSDEAQWIALLDAVDTRFGRLDVLINNAGYFRPNIAFEEMPLDLWRRHFAVSADGTFLGCKHGILRMRPHGDGAIVNIGSGMSIQAVPTAAAYCAAKAAVLMTTRTAAGAAGPYGIRVNAVLPGAVDTAMLRGNMQQGESADAFLDRMAGYGALGRLATPEDIARAVIFLADPRNSALTGVHLPVDGGTMPGG